LQRLLRAAGACPSASMPGSVLYYERVVWRVLGDLPIAAALTHPNASTAALVRTA
jgi:hypothetical protein